MSGASRTPESSPPVRGGLLTRYDSRRGRVLTETGRAFGLLALLAGYVLIPSSAAQAQTADVTVTPTSLEVDEGSTATYTVKLVNKEPTASVTITVSKSGGGDANLSADTNMETTGNQNALTFTTLNWNTTQTVTVSAAQDMDMAAGTATFTHAATSGDADYDGITIASVTATEVDDEAGICGRTKAVRDALVATIPGVSTCAAVTTAQLATVTELNLVNKDITSLKAGDFDGLTTLTTLLLWDNRLTALPNLDTLTALTRLAVSSNRLTALPDLSKLTKLTHLELANNLLTVLPDLSQNTKLTQILANFNRLTALPDLSQNTKLTRLVVKNNLLTALPDLSKLTKLTHLDSSSSPKSPQKNRLTALPDLSQNTKLTHLIVHENRLTVLPDLSQNTKLTHLIVHENRLTALPDLSPALRELSAYNNRLTSLPDLSQLTALRELSVYNNRLTALPDLSPALRKISASDNRLTSLPDLNQLTALRELYVHRNQLTVLPDLSQLTALTRLAVSDNRLTSLPDLSQLTALRDLYVHGNQLTSLPDLSQLTNLTTFYVHGNPLSNLSALTLTDAEGNAIALTPAFAGNTIAYIAKVGSAIASVTVTPTAADTGVMPKGLSTTYPLPTIKVGPQGGMLTAVTSGATSSPIALRAGRVNIDIKVSGRAAAGSSHGARGTKTYRIRVNPPPPPNRAPTFSSPATFTVAENQTLVGTVVARARRAGPVTGYALVEGLDHAQFALTSAGVLTFRTAPDYERPVDVMCMQPANAARNNEYVVGVRATSGAGARTQVDNQPMMVTVMVTNVNEGPAGRPTITGTAQVGQTLTAATDDIRDPDGLTEVSYAYQWFRVDGATETAISGATAGTYVPVAADVGQPLKVQVAFTDDGSFPERLSSAETKPVMTSAGQQRVVTAALAEIGRATLAGAADVIGQRFDATPTGAAVTLAGRRVEVAALLAPEAAARAGRGQPGASRLGPGRRLAGLPEPGLNLKAVLQNSAFTLPLNENGHGTGGGHAWTLWGRGDLRQFTGRVGDGAWDGAVQAGWLGVDAQLRARLLAGAAVSRSEGTVDYRVAEPDADDGTLETSMTAVWPYVQMERAGGGALRLLLGTGRGEARHRTPARKTKTDLNMLAGVLGGRWPFAEIGDFTLSAVGDTGALRMTTDGPAYTALKDLEVAVWRLRGSVEAQHAGFGLLGSAWQLAPRGSLAARHDGGDGVTGTGLEVAGGVRLAAPASRFALEADGYWLAVHSAAGRREWGASLDARLQPGTDGLGLALALGSQLGVPLSRTLEREAVFNGGPSQATGEASLTAAAGYGIRALAGVLMPYTGVALTKQGLAQSRGGLSLRWGVPTSAGTLEVAVAGEHRAPAGGQPEQTIGVQLQLQFGRGGPGRLPTRRTSRTAGPPHEASLPQSPSHKPAAPPDRADSGRYFVQLGAFKHPANALSARTALAGQLSGVLRLPHRRPAVVAATTGGLTHVLVALAFRTRRAAAGLCAALKARGLDCSVVRGERRSLPLFPLRKQAPS